jgi:excisionase family DNA binding protein
MDRSMPKSVFIKEAAALLGVSRRTVYYRIKERRLQTVRTACGSQRVLVESISALLREELSSGVRDRDAVASDTDPSVKFPAT